MSNKEQFQQYAGFYDALYQNKDYQKEAELVDKALKESLGRQPKKILSLGCGTGTYEILLAKMGYEVVGVDLSAEMIKIGQQKVETAGISNKVKLIQGDIRNLRELGEFEAAVMLFNIVGYMNTNEDMARMLASVNRQLVAGGIFLFDGWNAAAVLRDPPTDRVKEIEEDGKRIIRITKSKLDLARNIVEINFHVLQLAGTQVEKEAIENHPMRYFSLPELAYFMEIAGMKMIKASDFEDWESEVSGEKWDMWVVGQKK